MHSLDNPMHHLPDAEIKQRLEHLTFAIALDTTHYYAFSDHRRPHLQKELFVKKQALRALREERERRILAGRYQPYE